MEPSKCKAVFPNEKFIVLENKSVSHGGTTEIKQQSSGDSSKGKRHPCDSKQRLTCTKLLGYLGPHKIPDAVVDVLDVLKKLPVCSANCSQDEVVDELVNTAKKEPGEYPDLGSYNWEVLGTGDEAFKPIIFFLPKDLQLRMWNFIERARENAFWKIRRGARTWYTTCQLTQMEHLANEAVESLVEREKLQPSDDTIKRGVQLGLCAGGLAHEIGLELFLTVRNFFLLNERAVQNIKFGEGVRDTNAVTIVNLYKQVIGYMPIIFVAIFLLEEEIMSGHSQRVRDEQMYALSRRLFLEVETYQDSIEICIRELANTLVKRDSRLQIEINKLCVQDMVNDYIMLHRAGGFGIASNDKFNVVKENE